MLLRYYVNFYDMEIIEEEAFLSWKEDLTQEYPGKGKALFQVMCSHWSMALCGLPPLTPLCLFVNETLQWLYCCSGAGESVADLAGDCRRGGVRGWRVLRNRPKPCLIRCRLVLGFFFSLLIFPSFLFCFFSSCLSRSSCNHCYSSFHNEIVLPASQILFMLQVSILFSLMSYSRCFIHFNQLGFKSRQYLAGKCTSTQNLTHFCHRFTSGRSHQVLSQLFKNCLQKRELALQRGFLLF